METYQTKPDAPPALRIDNVPRPLPPRRMSIVAVVVLVAALFGCAIYANLALAVTDQANLKYFPPFRAYFDANHNNHLGAEYFNIARAMVAGQGFANPFSDQTGPTAWMPPVLPTILAGLLWVSGGNRDLVMAAFIFLQVYVLVFTGLLVLALLRRTTSRLGTWVAALIFFIWVINDFHTWFQFTHDCWVVLLAVDIVVGGCCWLLPLRSRKAAAAWGLCGGLVALINPIVAFAWGMLTMLSASSRLGALGPSAAPMAFIKGRRAWSRPALAMVVAALVVAPWIVRNYLLFGRMIPVKSNLGYELYQSQCLMPDGLLQNHAFSSHPFSNAGRERQDYAALGEMAYLDRKQELFRQSVRADPLDFADRVAARFLGATLWYTPFNRGEGAGRPWVLWWARLTHPLPFLALLFLVFSGTWQRLHWYQWTAIGVYFLYLLPYIGVSYYERYAVPLVGVKALLVIWAFDRLSETFWCYHDTK